MLSKLISAGVGALLLAGSGLALADRDDRDGRHGWRERGGHERHWSDRRPHGHWKHGPHARKHFHEHHRHYYPRWHAPHSYYKHHGYRSGWGHSRYDDGVTIIFKGRID
jgi:hypothetical protein